MGDGSLRACQRTAWLRCKLTGQLAHLLLEAVGGNEAVDDAQPVRVRRRQRLAGEEHLVRDPGSREAREKPAHPAIRSQPDVHERLEQIRLGRRNPYVAREGKARADADRRPIHRRDHRLRHCAQARQHRHVLVAQDVADVFGRTHAGPLHHLGDVGARAEGAARTGQHHNPHRLVALGLLDGLGELLACERTDGVHLLRPVEPDQADAIVRLNVYVHLDLSRHVFPSPTGL